MAQTSKGRYIETLVEALAGKTRCTWCRTVSFSITKKLPSKPARDVCMQCPVILTCAVYASLVEGKEGTWAGITYNTQGKNYV